MPSIMGLCCERKHSNKTPLLAYIFHLRLLHRQRKLASGVGHAADFGDPEDKAGFVAALVVADQLAFPVAQEVASMLA